MTDVRSWPKNWNYAALRRMTGMEERSSSRTWPLIGMLALGLLAGAALGGYAMSQRVQIKRLASYASRKRDEFARIAAPDLQSDAVVKPRSNHRRKATSEV